MIIFLNARTSCKISDLNKLFYKKIEIAVNGETKKLLRRRRDGADTIACCALRIFAALGC
ncbi:hypothetical protein wcw_1829 [Waddlia chondrophila WSU 86-1044]|uniref:Uncharacterized protein n=1 Tax=Waddlia chondrophila (strain ATCC VR-1470 / WSU 86-1044) TaxID=716544 RepID=D6YSX3_WADCW|nr:hypothetical protein wcw_1829 [Waddlia chondrophila WSU 86-1044]